MKYHVVCRRAKLRRIGGWASRDGYDDLKLLFGHANFELLLQEDNFFTTRAYAMMRMNEVLNSDIDLLQAPPSVVARTTLGFKKKRGKPQLDVETAVFLSAPASVTVRSPFYYSLFAWKDAAYAYPMLKSLNPLIKTVEVPHCRRDGVGGFIRVYVHLHL